MSLTAKSNGGVVIIAEAGVNHNGDLDAALGLIDAAAEAGADAVKFQTFKAEDVVIPAAAKAEYQKITTGSGETQLDMIRRLELSHDDHWKLVRHATERNIAFLSTPFDPESLRFLTEDLNLAVIKFSSGDITNGPMLLAAAKTNRDIILSTGMSTLEEVEAALAVLAFGYAGVDAAPSEQAFAQALASQVGREALSDHVTLLHCTTEYPAPFADVNLRAMDTLRDAFSLPVGLSDHTTGHAVAVAAVGRGAVMIEKHFTLDRSQSGPDHRASLEPHELTGMVEAIRQVEAAMGDGRKRPMDSEEGNKAVARKSLVTLEAVAKGEVFTERNLGAKRPGDGISPMEYWNLLGRPAGRDYARDESL